MRILALMGIVVILGVESLSASTRVSVLRDRLQAEGERTVVAVNGVPHQVIEPTGVRRRFEPLYFRPYELLRTPPGNVLVVGAGTGGDVAIALAEGADHVDAVEIDPRLADLGEERNPERPYDDPRVDLVIDDGRAFLERTTTRYDPDPLRTPGLADPRLGAVLPQARELPLHERGVRSGARSPRTRRYVRRLQLLP